jgi:four helix bundle protein
VDQLRRSSAAVANNIAEGYARNSNKEKIRFLYIAKGEAEETKRNLLRSAKKEFLTVAYANELANDYTELIKMISGYIKYLQERK